MGIFCMTQGTQTGALWQAEGWGGKGDGREVLEGGDIGVPMLNSCWCMIDNHKILKSNYPLIKKFKKNQTQNN